MKDVNQFSVLAHSFPPGEKNYDGVVLSLGDCETVCISRDKAIELIRSLAIVVEGWGEHHSGENVHSPEWFKSYFEREEEVHEEPSFYLAIHRAIELFNQKER